MFHPIAPHESNSTKWLRLKWIDLHSRNGYGIITTGFRGTRQTARVKAYGDILRVYEFHLESKCSDANENPGGKQTVGLLYRWHIRIEHIACIGKESNRFEDVESGLIHSEQSVYTEYPDPKRDEWQMKILPALRKAPLPLLVKKSGMSRWALMDARAGRSRTHQKQRERLASIVRKLGIA